MELLIAFLIFGSVTAIMLAVITMRSEAQVATQMRLERVAGHLGDDWNMPATTPLRGSRLSNIAFVERFLGDLDLARSIDMKLIRADWSLKVSEFLAIIGVAGAIGLLIGRFALGSLIFGLPLAVAFAYLPFFVLKRAVLRRRAKLEQQLPEMLVMVANALKAGFGLLQAMDQASKQLDGPVAKELRQTVRDTQIGSSIDDAVRGLSLRVGSYDLEIVVTAILVQRNVGGNLAEILENVAHTMRERERIRGEIATLTAQQRLTGYVLAGVPFGLGAIFWVLNPSYMNQLLITNMGRMMLGGAFVLEIIGWFVISKIVNIDV